MTNPLVAPSNDFTIIEGGRAHQDLQQWMEDITNLVNSHIPLTGSGSPEGVEVASVGRWYVDTSAGAGTGIYFKEANDTNLGWVLRS